MKKAHKAEIKQLGIKIRKMRESLNMTQTDLSDKCDVDIRTIQRIENGEYGYGIDILFALAEALQTEASDLLKG